MTGDDDDDALCGRFGETAVTVDWKYENGLGNIEIGFSSAKSIDSIKFIWILNGASKWKDFRMF